MVNPIERARARATKRIIQAALFGATFSISFTLFDAIYFQDIYIFFTYIICIIMYAAMLVNYYLTFKKKFIPIKYSIINFVSVGLITMAVLTFIAGGFSGAMISGYFFIIFMGGLLFEKKQALLLSGIVIFMYLTFLFGESFGLIQVIVTDPEVIKFSTVIIDMLSFGLVTYFLVMMSENSEYAMKFFKLRSVRLSKMRKRLEFLVKRRTKELNESNKKLKVTQKQLRKSLKELKKLDVKKDEFISVAAHELKTPLTAISGYSQLLKRNKVIKNAKKRKMFLKILDSESRRLSLLVSEMLDLSRLDMDATRYNIEEVNIYEFMEVIHYEFRHKIEEKGLKYEFKLNKNLPKISTDKDKLHEIITNLISNSFKYTPKGKITVSAKRRGKYLEFCIKDTGIGIPNRYHKKIFERFFQIDSSLARETEGTGLGLAIVKEYVERLGGKINLKSKTGKGTSFFVRMPIKPKIKARKDKINLIVKK